MGLIARSKKYENVGMVARDCLKTIIVRAFSPLLFVAIASWGFAQAGIASRLQRLNPIDIMNWKRQGRALYQPAAKPQEIAEGYRIKGRKPAPKKGFETVTPGLAPPRLPPFSGQDLGTNN